MAVQITQNQGVKNVLGAVSSENTTLLKEHFNHLFKMKDAILINLDALSLNGPTIAFILKQLYPEFMGNDRALQFTGRHNKTLIQVLKNTRTSYTLSNDSI